MTDSGTVDFHISPYEHTNNIWANLWLSCDVPFASRYFTKPRVHRYPPESSHAHYTDILVTGFVLLSRYRVPASPWRSNLCLARRCWMPSHREGPKNISPSSEEQIPLSSYPVTCQTFRRTCKLSLWSPCYRWRLSNPKAHRTVRSDRDTLMV
jgi:hypothetical protein